MAELGFGDLLELLGHEGFTSVCNKPAKGAEFRSRVVSSLAAGLAAADLTGDVWFGVNPVKGPARTSQGRGTAADVVRLAAVFADLDVKPGGMPTMEAAGLVISDLSDMLGTRPSALVLSGHGMQPYWVLEGGPSGAGARALLRRFGRLVAHVAEIRGGQVDPVYDLARVLRVPGTTNYKSEPVAVIGLEQDGRPLTPGELDDALRAYGATELPGDRDEPGQHVVSDPGSWAWAGATCHYIVAMMDAWATDEPAARHPWLMAQATRISVAHRNGCFDRAGYYGAQGVLVNRFRALIARGSEARNEAPGEIADALAWGRDLAGSMTEYQVAQELGRHTHEPTDVLTFDRSSIPNFPSVSAFSGPVGTPGQPDMSEASIARLRITWASEISPKRVRWLWDGRIAQGTLALLAGREGLGKSTLAYHLAGEVTRGSLKGEHYGMPRVVLVCANEDSWEHTITPRLIAAGADLTKVARIDAEIRTNVHLSLSLPRDNDELKELAIKYDAGLLILDPLMSVVDGTIDTHRDREVRLALEPLVALAEESRMGIVGLIHHNKGSSADPLNMVMASKAFTAVARSVHTCIADPDDETEERRLFATTKNNLGQMNLPVLGFTIASFPVETEDDGTAWTGKLHWTGEVEGKMRDIMGRGDDQDRGATAEATEWLGDYLHSVGGTASRKDIERAATAAGHKSPSTLKRAKERLKIGHRSEGFPRQTFWYLPESAPVGPAGPNVVPLVRLQNQQSDHSPGETVLRSNWDIRSDYPNGETVGPVGPAGPDPTREVSLCASCSGLNQNPNSLWCDDCLSSARGDAS